LARETPAAVVLDLATPGHSDAVMHWLRRDASRAGMMVVQVSALARHGGAPRGELRADVLVPKPFTPRQIVDGVRTALARRAARQRLARPRALRLNRGALLHRRRDPERVPGTRREPRRTANHRPERRRQD